uniref:Ubiquitin-like domain-containing protein n=1 Tax=Sphaeramia orbicularis TaxID=375764 RepID=A0A672Z9V7_9TELE
MGVQLNVTGPRGEEKIIDLCDSEDQMKRLTVMHLKKKIIKELGIGKVITFCTLDESHLLTDYGIRHLSIIHTLLILPGGILKNTDVGLYTCQ